MRGCLLSKLLLSRNNLLLLFEPYLGRVRVSEEGINGTLWGSEHAIKCYEEHARTNYEDPKNPIDFKRSRGSSKDFEGLQVRYPLAYKWAFLSAYTPAT